jgi:hypothetical protein
VIRRVFEGGVGCCRGGREERSIDIGVLDPLDETGRDVGGELSELSVAILVIECCLGETAEIIPQALGEECCEDGSCWVRVQRGGGGIVVYLLALRIFEVCRLSSPPKHSLAKKPTTPTFHTSHSKDGREDAANAGKGRDWLEGVTRAWFCFWNRADKARQG